MGYLEGVMMTLICRATVIGLFAISTLSVGCGRDRRAARADKLKDLISAEIPTGSSESQVVGFLDRRGFKYANEIQSQKEIFAVAPDSSGSDVVKTKFQVTFQFDDGRRLRDYTVSESLVGP
jgi:hypothetical protein